MAGELVGRHTSSFSGSVLVRIWYYVAGGTTLLEERGCEA